MKKKLSIVALLAALLAAEANAQTHQNRRRGVLLGGLAGAAIGVAIGDKGDNETTGALIGGAVGAIAGGTIGNQQDQINEHNRRYHSPYGHAPHSRSYPGSASYGSQPAYPHQGSPSYYQPQIYNAVPASPSAPVRHAPTPVIVPPPPAPAVSLQSKATAPTATGVTKQDVLRMNRSGMSDATIIRQLKLHGIDRALSVQEVIELHEAGISEGVIEAMQTALPEANDAVTVSTSSSSSTSSTVKKAAVPSKSNTGPDALYGPSVLPPPPRR
jgi:hypothetical protein